ncbi:MAG TPA: DNA-binding domain-containing protein [Rhodanobacteraceae bacterium]
MDTALSLRELQRQFMAALYDADAPGPVAAIAGNGLTAAGRLRIYRSSCSESHIAALRVTYPAVRALVGDAFFEQTARGYRRVHPSRSGNLQAFGAELGDYLATLAACHPYPYLPDVARLEWLRQAAILAPAAATAVADAGVERTQTTAVPVHVELHPSLHLLRSAYPILRIWRYALQPSAEGLTLDGEGECVALWREDGEVAMGAIDAASFACIAALQRGADLAAAAAAGVALDPAFDCAACVGTLSEHRLMVGVEPVATGDAPGTGNPHAGSA